jgi:putative sporulation protein YtaF
MLINSLILALSSSIDSLGIGITYGIKNTKISYIGKFVLFIISFSISLLSVWFGDIIKNIFSDFATKFIGNVILIGMGIFVCFQAIRKNKIDLTSDGLSSEPIYESNEKIYSFFIDFLGITIKIIKNPSSSDLDSSNSIDGKEALFLGFALSLDCFCIGACGSIIGISSFLFPLFISIFQLVFLNFGNTLGKKLNQLSNLPDNIWSIISGTLLILIGAIRFIFIFPIL